MNFSDLNKVLKDALGPLYPDREIESIGRLVLEHLTGMSWVQIRLNYNDAFSEDQQNRIREIIARLIRHEPVQYILGETEFYGMKIRVRAGVLIPRGETEELVDWVIKCQDQGRKPGFRTDDRIGIGGVGNMLRVLDIGCGSGAIAIALARHLPDSEVTAVDISADALQLTRENADLNGGKIAIHHFDILQNHPREEGDPRYDMIVSNPPYVPLGEKAAMDAHVVEYEPEIALFVPDNDPLLFYRAIAAFAAANLNPGGQVFVEIHDRLGGETADIFRKLFLNVELSRDIHGKDRMIRAYNG